MKLYESIPVIELVFLVKIRMDMAHKNTLKGKKVAILATDGFEEVELKSPMEELRAEDATVQIVSEKPKIRSWHNRDWHGDYNVDVLLEDADPEDYDMLLIPGGVINPDRLRRNPMAVEFIQKFNDTGRLIASICHGPQMLIEADLVRGKKLTSFHSIRKDLINAGAEWIDNAVVLDGNLLTSRHPGDIPSFMKKINGILKMEKEYLP